MTKVYLLFYDTDTGALLFYDTDTGAREEWNTFYTPCEVFTNPEDRQKRIEHIKKLAAQLDEGEFEFHEHEVDVMNENTIYDNPFDY